MPNDTTPDPSENGTQENEWEARYVGLQKVVAKRDTDLHTTQAALDALKAEHEAAQTELTSFRQKVVDASEEETARTTYEALKARFEAEPPTPIGNNPARPARGWEDGSGSPWGDRERVGTDMGFPT